MSIKEHGCRGKMHVNKKSTLQFILNMEEHRKVTRYVFHSNASELS